MMWRRRRLRKLLEAAGQEPVPSIDAEFAAALEARLLSTAPDALVEPPTASPRRRSFSGGVALLPAAAAIAAIVVFGALVGWFAHDQATQKKKVSLVAAVDTVVELPNGKHVDGERGLKLPDGTVVRTGPNGRATIGNVHLGPGQEVTVNNGKIKVSPPPTTLPTVPPATVPTIPQVTIPTLPQVTIPTLPPVTLPHL